MIEIKQKIAELTGNDERQQKLKEQFSFLQNIADSKCNEFRTELEKMFMSELGKCKIIGNKAVHYYQGQYVDINVGYDKAISQAIDSFFKEKNRLKDGFKTLVKGTMLTFIEDTSIEEHRKDFFFIYPENFSIVRVDIKCYKYTFQKNEFISKYDNLFCYTMAKSIVDHSKLTLDELIYLATNTVNLEDRKIDAELVIEFLKELKQVWEYLTNTIQN